MSLGAGSRIGPYEIVGALGAGGGREIYFLSPDGSIWAADVDPTNGFRSGVPHKLIDAGPIQSVGNHPYVVSQDGERFLYGVFDRSALWLMTIVLNWVPAGPNVSGSTR